MQAPAQGQANPQDPPNPPGESPADEEPAKQQQEEELLAQAKSIRSAHVIQAFCYLIAVPRSSRR